MTEPSSYNGFTVIQCGMGALGDQTRAPSLSGSGGDGTSGIMEQKVAVLESDVKEIKADLKILIKDVAELKGKVSHLPATLQMLGFVVAIVVAAGLVKHFFP